MAFDGVFDPDLDWRDARARGFNVFVGPFKAATVAEGVERFYMQTDERHRNFGGVTHGGVVMTALDYGMGVVTSLSSDAPKSTTIGMTVQFVAAVPPGALLHGEARVIRTTRDVCFTEAEVWADGRQCATATGIFKYLWRAKPTP